MYSFHVDFLPSLSLRVVRNTLYRNLSDCGDGDYFHLGGHDGDRSQLPLQGSDRQASSSLDEKVRHNQLWPASPLFLPSLSVRHTRSVARIPCLLVGAETSGMDDDELRRRRRKMMNYLSFLSIATNRFDESLASFSDLDICSDRLAGATIIRNARWRITRLSKKWRLQRRRRLRPLSYRPAVVWATDADSKAPRPAAPPVARISLRPSLCTAAQPAATAVITTGVWPTRPLLPSRLSR